MLAKDPPAKTVDPLSARAETRPPAPGFQPEATPALSSAAMRLRACPPIVVKSLPTYTVEALGKSARTATLRAQLRTGRPTVDPAIPALSAVGEQPQETARVI